MRVISLTDQAKIHRKCNSRGIKGRLVAVDLLGTHFSNLSDIDQAWNDLHKLTLDEVSDVRRSGADALGKAFSHFRDKDQAWKDLIRLTQDEDSGVRRSAAYALGTVFVHVPNKYRDLHRLTHDKGSDVRGWAAIALGKAFGYVPDKDQAGKDMHRLTLDKNNRVRWNAADALGTAFGYVPDKDQAWKDLVRLAQGEDSYVRMFAYHSLGRATIFKATRARNNGALKRELEAAVIYFEKSSQESKHGPARFCHPFYRTYLAITFQEAKEEEVQRYLAEAKEAVGGSKSKDELLKAVENLAGALKEAQLLKNRSFPLVIG